MSGAVFSVSEARRAQALSDDTSKKQLEVERQAYERLGSHPRIPVLLGSQQDAIILERLQCTLRHRLLDLRSRQQRPATLEVLRWALQTAEALQYIHSRGVKQVDIGIYNVLLDQDDNAKLADFSGSSLDGSEPTVAPSAHATHPRLSTFKPSVNSELFAFGSLLYELETTFQPFHEKQDHEVEALFEANQFPSTTSLVLGEVIAKCWMVSYQDASDVITDIQSIQDRIETGVMVASKEESQNPRSATEHEIDR
jgi:serine/threonine protein kinase